MALPPASRSIASSLPPFSIKNVFPIEDGDFDKSIALNAGTSSLANKKNIAMELGNFDKNEEYLNAQLSEANSAFVKMMSSASTTLKKDAVNFISHPRTIKAGYLFLSSVLYFLYNRNATTPSGAGQTVFNTLSSSFKDKTIAANLFNLVQSVASVHALNASGAVDYVSNFLNKTLASAFDTQGTDAQMQALNFVFQKFIQDAEPLLKKMPAERSSAFRRESDQLKAGIEASLLNKVSAISYPGAITSLNKLLSYLSMPVARVNHRRLEDSQIRAESIVKRDSTEAFLGTYDVETVQEPFMRFLTEMAHYSMNADKMPIPMLYLEGLPATAKTYLVNEIFENREKYHIIRTDLNTFINYIQKRNSNYPQKNFFDNLNPIIVEIIKKVPEKTVIFFIDEVNFNEREPFWGDNPVGVVNEWWSKARNGSHADGEMSNELGVRSGASGGVIFASNNLLENAALRSRMIYAQVAPPSVKKQKEILNSKLESVAGRLAPNISAATKKQVENELGKYLEFLFKQSQKYDYEHFNIRHGEQILDGIALYIADQIDMKRPIERSVVEDRILSQINLVLAVNGQEPIPDEKGYSLLREGELYSAPQTDEDKRQATLNAIKQRWPDANLDEAA